MRSVIFSFFIVAVVFLMGVGGVLAQDSATGPVTHLPLPRFVSLKVGNANIRRGPSQSHRIDWILTRKGTPLLITAEFGHWRRVQDEDGAGGWIHYALLSGQRTIVIRSTRVSIHNDASETSKTVALAEKGVIASLGSCTANWCKITVDNISGWVVKTSIWGVGAAEIRK